MGRRPSWIIPLIMSYQVLARKWRPRTFQELAGQEHVVRALTNALEHNRLHHAYLFTGTRGVGKTTIARILAKSLNCEQGVTATPCGVCNACREISEGRFIDLIEVDAASRTKVEDTRELLENVQYAPTYGRYKVYLIDEVHMLSSHSFNALLKTLEEPPPHIKFLLATTDPQKLPVTVLSRCLQFNLKRLPVGLISKHLNAVLEQENIEREPAAVNLIARAGEGSMRDALSLLDQAIAFGDGRVQLADVSAMLGDIDQGRIIQLLETLAGGDAQQLLEQVAALDRLAPDYETVVAELLSLLQRVALAQFAPAAVDHESWPDPEAIQRLANAMPPEDTQLFYQIALLGRRDLALSPDPRGGFEMLLLRMLCFRPADAAVSAPQTPPATARPPVTATAPKAPAAPADPPPAAPAPSTEWGTLIEQLNLKGMAQQLALNSILQKREDNALYLMIPPEQAHLRIKNAEERLRAALEAHFGTPLRLSIQIGAATAATPAQQQSERQAQRQQAALETLNQDPNVKSLCETFDGQLKPDSVTPTD